MRGRRPWMIVGPVLLLVIVAVVGVAAKSSSGIELPVVLRDAAPVQESAYTFASSRKPSSPSSWSHVRMRRRSYEIEGSWRTVVDRLGKELRSPDWKRVAFISPYEAGDGTVFFRGTSGVTRTTEIIVWQKPSNGKTRVEATETREASPVDRIVDFVRRPIPRP